MRNGSSTATSRKCETAPWRKTFVGCVNGMLQLLNVFSCDVLLWTSGASWSCGQLAAKGEEVRLTLYDATEEFFVFNVCGK
jgi:hypothetical protein